jgi:proteasome lid subunit RPN8/RPN11
MKPPYPAYVLDRIKALALESPCEEVGGIVVAAPGAYRVIQIPNCSCEPDSAYIPYGLGLLEASKLGSLEFYWHTHLNGNSNFSPTDITGIWETEIPWLLYDVYNDRFNYFDPDLETPLLGRTWELGLTDCWALVRDFYRWHLGIILPPPEATGERRPWTDPAWNRVLEQLPQYFDRIPSLKDIEPYDAILYKNPVENHAPGHVGIALPTENGLQLLHHFYKRVSNLEPIIQPDRIHSIWRSKCPISPLNYSVLWGVDSGTPTSLQPPKLTKVSVICGISSPTSSDPSSN